MATQALQVLLCRLPIIQRYSAGGVLEQTSIYTHAYSCSAYYYAIPYPSIIEHVAHTRLCTQVYANSAYYHAASLGPCFSQLQHTQ
jgi:hypothetical protein